MCVFGLGSILRLQWLHFNKKFQEIPRSLEATKWSFSNKTGKPANRLATRSGCPFSLTSWIQNSGHAMSNIYTVYTDVALIQMMWWCQCFITFLCFCCVFMKVNWVKWSQMSSQVEFGSEVLESWTISQTKDEGKHSLSDLSFVAWLLKQRGQIVQMPSEKK